MKKIPVVLSLAVFALSCQKNEIPEEEERLIAREGVSNALTMVCDEVTINLVNKAITIKGTTYYYPYNPIDLTGYPTDATGNALLKTNCIDVQTATPWQIEVHQRADSVINIVRNIFLNLNNPPAASYPSYTMTEFQTAMDNTPWEYGSDGADYVSTIFNGTIRKSPSVQKLPGISAVLLAAAITQNKDFTEVTLQQAINYSNHAEAFVVALGLRSTGDPLVTVIDYRYFRHDCGSCELIEKIAGRQGSGTGAATRLSSFFDYNTSGSIRYYMYNGS